MLRVALTGGIAAGKTEVSNALREHGAVIIDADLLARQVVEPGTPGLAAVIERFGPDLLLVTGELDRELLGRIVFSDQQARRDLEAIIHPLVRARAAEIEARTDPQAVVVHVIPLLVETGQQEDFDVVVVVDVTPRRQLNRLLERTRGVSRASALARIEAQASRQERLRVADLVLDNNGSRADLVEQVDGLWRELRHRATAG